MEELGDESTQSTNANRFGGAPYKIDQSTFTKRLQVLYSHWREHKDELWGSADFYTVATPPPTEDIRYLKSSPFNIWLLGYEFPDTIMVFGSKQIHFLSSQKNAVLLDSVKVPAKEAVDVDVVMHVKQKGDDGTSEIDDVLRSMRTSKSEDHDAPIVGYIAEESPEGSFFEKWMDRLKKSGLQLFDVTDGLYDIFCVKDPNGAEAELGPMLNKFKPIRLSDLRMYPPFNGPRRKMSGILEAHANGFRYSTSGQDDERVDIMLANIKHAFFQPAERLRSTLLHFHLYNHMMVGNKETKDLRFSIEALGEETKHIQKQSNNTDFKNFVLRVYEEGHGLEFEQPQVNLGFHGQPSNRRTAAFIVPTSSCLVELTNTPFLVITLSEIAIVNLERIRCRGSKGQKEFDMAIVFKDMKRDVKVIKCIPLTSLEGIKAWMEAIAGIKYHESRVNLKWRSILDTFIDEPQVFVDVGGWDFLNLNDNCNSD